MAYFNRASHFITHPLELILVLALILLFFSPWIHRSTVFSGDEPHYLIVANSILRLGKLDLREAYDRQQLGNDFAGKVFQGIPLDHHTVLVDSGLFPPKYLGRWHDYAEGKTVDISGRQLPPVPENYSEYSSRAIAWPASIAFFSFCTSLPTEIASKLLSHLCVLFSAAFVYLLILRIEGSKRGAVLATIAYGLGSCNLIFANTAFADSALLLYFSSASYLFSRRRVFLLALVTVIGVWLKFQLLLPAAVLFGLGILQSGIKKNIIPLLFGVVGILSFFVFNFFIYGLIKPPMGWSFCSPFDSIYYFIFSPSTSFFLRNPWILAPLLLIGSFKPNFRIQRLCLDLAIFFLLAILPIFLWEYYSGGYCYPGRLIICATIPAAILLAFTFDSCGKLKRGIAALLVAIGLIVNWKAAFALPQLTWKPGWDWLFIF